MLYQNLIDKMTERFKELKHMARCFAYAMIFAMAASAANIVAVLEVVPGGDDVELTLSEYRQISDELRTRARNALPKSFSVLTRENILQLVPPDEKEAECLAESCAVEIGRAIGAEYIASGEVRMFAGKLILSVQLYESMSGNLLGSFSTSPSEDILVLLNEIEAKSTPMFERIPGVKPETPPEQKVPEQKIPVDTAPPPPAFKVGLTAKAGFAKSSVKEGKGDIAYSFGLVAVKNLGFIDIVPELLLSSEEFEINTRAVSIMKIDIPVTARVILAKSIGISLGAVVALPLSSKIEDEVPKDVMKFGLAATGGLSYFVNEAIFVSAFYEKHFIDNFKSVKNSKTDKVLCGIAYLF
jgi:hypothetical protein